MPESTRLNALIREVTREEEAVRTSPHNKPGFSPRFGTQPRDRSLNSDGTPRTGV